MASQRRTTIHDVAALAGVSRSAVSKAMNGQEGLAPGTRKKILAAAATLDWSPSPAASTLRGSRSRSVGLVISRGPDLLAADAFFAVLIAGAESVLAPRRYGLQLHLLSTAQSAESETYRQLTRDRRVDGFILTESRIRDARFELLRELGAPFVLIGEPWQDDRVEHILVSDAMAGMRDLAQHLVQAGHRRILYVGGPEDLVHTLRRREAFARALEDAGGPLPRVVSAAFDAKDARRATREALAVPERPTVIVYGNDTMAIAGAGEAQRLGFRVPEDVAVVGYDNLPMGEWVYPTITTVAQDLHAIGAAAAAALLRELGDTSVEIPPVAPSTLVIRESTTLDRA
ncbi:LacI family DNA-binding transcriptional regulator [Ruania alba]|uniref:DNA-binding transcriptional regulator, LacI/PurR family n=1 Tax=Ruania alba TaxID=648782 RepID=A0A1H5KIZ0_9MICO|nr:LacI family DNA-binding transcriptional regulator [Ruania alba]SEE64584.1 DNA-binding transcriptional regulator, LacI/PurR family [Ruania alba]